MTKTVYVMKGIESGLVKIGVTGNLKVRRDALVSYEGEEVELVYGIETEHYKVIEGSVKWNFKDSNVVRTTKNEWFDLPESTLIEFLNAAMEEIEKEPLHAPRWMKRYIINRRNNKKDMKIWFHK